MQPAEKKIIVESPWISRDSQIRRRSFESVKVTFHRTSHTRENLFSMLFLITVIKTFVISRPVAKICPNTRTPRI